MTKHEREVQAQMTTMQQHMESLLQVVNESTATVKLLHHILDVKLFPLSVKDYIEAYLVTFERIVRSHDPEGPVALSPGATVSRKSSAGICSFVIHPS